MTLKSAAHAVLPTSAYFRRRSQIAGETVPVKLCRTCLSLNSPKTEVLLCATSRRQHLNLSAPVRSVDGIMVGPVTSVRDLGIYIDADLSTGTLVSLQQP